MKTPLIEELKNLRQKITWQRECICEVMDTHQFVEAADVYDLIQQKHKRVPMATIYRVLGELEGHGLVERVTVDGRKACFARTPETKKVRLVDSRTGDIADVSASTQLEGAIRRLAEETGVAIRDYNINVFVDKLPPRQTVTPG
ncbi:MAG: transcriptional repressor [Pseudomonadota bacterium]